MKYDFTIVGSGPAGISLALRLSENFGAKILLIESGSTKPSSGIQALSRINAKGDLPASHYTEHSQRIIGGTSSVWAGWCTKMEQRAFSLGGWPIRHKDLDDYYPQSAKILDLPVAAYMASSNVIDNSYLLYKPFYLSSPKKFSKKYLSVLTQDDNIDLMPESTCLKLNIEKNRIQSVMVQDSLDKRRPQTLKSDNTLLACGGLGNPRLLMLSGFNNLPALGRSFMEHPHIYDAGELILDRDAIAQFMSSSNIEVKPALQFSDGFCISENIPNFSVEFRLNKPSEMNFFGKRKQGNVSRTSIRAEMLPALENDIVLSNKQDQLGQRKGNIHFAVNYKDTAKHCWSLFGQQLIRSGIGRTGNFIGNTAKIKGGGHLMGTTRMGTDIRDSVVDANCKVHTVENLYIAGSSIFPYSGAANPTWTIVALAHRLADHLGQVNT